MKIKLCMGSSCFARGNAENLSYLEKFIEEKKLDAQIELLGCRCENCCSKGPNLSIDDVKYSGVTLDEINIILSKYIGE